MTQCEKIIEYMDTFGSITTYEAFIDLGIARLASRICDLKKEGWPIVSETVTTTNRYGEKIHYAKYKIKREAV